MTKDTAYSYYFYFNDKSYVKLIKRKYLDFDRYDNNLTSKISKKPNSFLQTNKDQIITAEEFLNFDGNKGKLVAALSYRKKVFLIDERDFKDSEILIREIKVFSSIEYLETE